MILVFKTDIQDSDAASIVGELLVSHDDIMKWNIDHWDIDKVLRIESRSDVSTAVIDSLNQAGIYCAPLED